MGVILAVPDAVEVKDGVSVLEGVLLELIDAVAVHDTVNVPLGEVVSVAVEDAVTVSV